MASTNTSYTSRTRLNHAIYTDKNIKLPAINYERTVSIGQPVSGYYRVESYSTELENNLRIPVQQVNTYEEYIAGCIEHERCLGHFCITSRGTLLLPQKLSSTLGIMSNEYARMAENIYARDTPRQEEDYREKLQTMMLGKSGKMRGDMPSGAVDSSARQIISLCWEIPPNHIAIPRMVAKNMKVLRVGKDATTGLPLAHYIEDHLRAVEYSDDDGPIGERTIVHDGDWVIVVRPPSLWAGNVQPMKVVLWDHECFGISPSNADEFHADHDGDEMQIYFVGREKSIEQCKAWKQLNPCKFEKAVRSMPLPKSFTKFNESKHGSMYDYISMRENFMVHSTLSIRELMDGVNLPEVSKAARMKGAMANMLVERLKNPQTVFEDFYSESLRGIKDVMAQQLNQGRIGDMSRQARLAASCVKYQGSGVFHIRASTETKRVVDLSIQDILYDTKYPLGGNSCMRAVSAICGVAQQAALDSHRVSQEISSSLNLAENLICGGDTTLVVFSGNPVMLSSWKYYDGKHTYSIMPSNSIKSLATKVIAAYNPTVLKEVKLMNGDIKSVCRGGISLVCNYYGIILSELELHSFAELLCYRCDASEIPITKKEGLLRRDMRWMTTIFANHFNVLRRLQSKQSTKRPVRPETITDAAAFCNFDFI